MTTSVQITKISPYFRQRLCMKSWMFMDAPSFLTGPGGSVVKNNPNPVLTGLRGANASIGGGRDAGESRLRRLICIQHGRFNAGGIRERDPLPLAMCTDHG